MNNNPQNRNVRAHNTQNSQIPKGGYISNFTLGCVIAVAVLVLVNIKIFSGIITENPETVQQNTASPNVPAVTEKDKASDAIALDIENNFVKVTVSSDDTKSGNLILVNNSHPFSFDSSPIKVIKEDLVVFYGRQSDDYVVSYPSRETLTPTAIEAFNALTADFASEKGIRNLLVLDSYRSFEDQQRVYEEKGANIATVPGCSEHHTGLAFDLEIHKVGNFDGTGDYAWVAQNCHKYGYILRYAEDKTAITGFSYEPWHFRYVGKEHAYYMAANNLCLEEYIDILSKYPIDSARLHVTTDDGETYVIYSQTVLGDSGEIYVPKDKEYTLSGDNNGHVIVSYKLQGQPEAIPEVQN